ncbi:MAG: hypothetical protein IJV69_06045, partial [Kiritimatiellae bacterium]|nr:hypothetical protein [Kiritimatiellia bacterium]
LVGNVTVNSGATLRLCHAKALYNAAVTVKGALSVEQATTVNSLAFNGGALSIASSAPLNVRDSLTSPADLVVTVTDLSEVGDWTILTYPESCTVNFTLADTLPEDSNLVAFLTRTETAVTLSVRSNDNVAWYGTKTVDEVTTDRWVVNDTTVEYDPTPDKHLYFNDVDGYPTATVAIPEEPVAITVTAQDTLYTLTGKIPAVPLTVRKGTTVTLNTTAAAPSAVLNEGRIIVTGNLDLTNANLSGYGTYVASTGATIRVNAQVMAEATATFERAGGDIAIVVTEDFSYPESRIPTSEGGTIIKEGTGTLYLPPAALTQNVTVKAGTLAPAGSMGLRARYLKFEAYERYTGWQWWAPSTGLSDFVTTLSGENQAWPEGMKIARFDSGNNNRVQIGIANDEQYSVTADIGGIGYLLDNNPSTEFRWTETHGTYGSNGSQRVYFVVDAGEEGVLFTGYNVGTPSNLNTFFWKWSVAMAHDISNWRPSTGDSAQTANEGEVWQILDERTLDSESYDGIATSSWMTLSGYTARRASGFWSGYTGLIYLNPGTTLDLSRAVGSSNVLLDHVEIATLAGSGTVVLPVNLKVKADVFGAATVRLTGSSVLREAITASTAARFSTLEVSESVAAAYNRGSATEYTLVEGFTGSVPTLQGMTSPTDGGTWVLAVEDSTLKLRLVGSQREVYATLAAETASWNALSWCDAFGETLNNIDWTAVQKVTLIVDENTPDTVALKLPAEAMTLPNLVIDYGETTGKTITLDETGDMEVSTLSLVGTDNGALLCTGAAPLRVTAFDFAIPDWTASVSLLNAAYGADSAYTIPESVTLGIAGSESLQTLTKYINGTGLIVFRGGTVKLSKEEQLGVMTRSVQVDAGATLDLNGCPLSCSVILNGGTLSNTGAGIGSAKRQTYRISLSADSFIDGTSNFYSLASGYALHSLNLNTYTLTKRGTNTFTIYHASIYDGTIVVEEGAVAVDNHSPNSVTLALNDVTLLTDGGTMTLWDPYKVEGTTSIGDGVVCKGNVTVAAGATLCGSGTIEGSLTMTDTTSVIEVTSAVDPLEVCGSISSAVTMRLGSGITSVRAAIPLLSMPNLEDITSVTITLSNQPENTTTDWVNNVYYISPEGLSSSATAVQATITEDVNWSELEWYDMSANAVTPDWRMVTSVTLLLKANATVTRDVATQALTTLAIQSSDYTLTLAGAPLPSTLTSLTVDSAITFEDGVITTVPTTLIGTKDLTFKSGVTSSASGDNNTYAYNQFTGNWIVEDGATLTLAGAGGKMGVLNTTDKTSDGRIIVNQGGIVKLLGAHVFGWADTANQQDRTVLVVDGGHVEVGSNNQYIRRTFEFKNGATMHASTNTIQQSRGGVIKVTEGEATFSGNFAFGCDANGGSRNAKWVVSTGARLNVPANVQNGTNAIEYEISMSGGGTVVMSGTNTYSFHGTVVDSNTTLLLNGTHRYAKRYYIGMSATFGGSGELVPISDNNCSVTFNPYSKLAIVDPNDPLSIQIGANGTLSFPSGGVSVTPPDGITMSSPAKLLTSTTALSTSNFSLTNTEGLGLDVTTSGSWYTLICKKVTQDDYSAIVADVNTSTSWDDLEWQTPEGATIVDGTMNWDAVTDITLRVSDDAVLQCPEDFTAEVPNLAKVNVVVQKTGATLTFAGNDIVLPTIAVMGAYSGTLLTTASSFTANEITVEQGTLGLGVGIVNGTSLLPTTPTYTLYGDGTLNKVMPGTTAVTITSGTIKAGATSQLTNRAVTVKAGATFDLNGYAQPIDLTLAGGTLTNTGSEMTDQSAWSTFNITLSADSTISGTAAIRSIATDWALNTFNLNGYTLTVNNSSTVYLTNPTIINGTIIMAAGTLDIGYGWDQANSWVKVDADGATLRNATIVTNGGSAIINRAMALDGTVILGEDVRLANGVNLTESATTALTLSANAFNGASTLTATNVTLTANVLPTRYPTIAATTLALADDYKALVAASETTPITLATISGSTPTIVNIPTTREVVVDGDVAYLALRATTLTAELTGEQSWDALTWKNGSTSADVTYVDVDKALITDITLTVTADATLTLADVKTSFPSLTALNIVYGTPGATLTFAGTDVALPTLVITGESGTLKTTVTTATIDSFSVAQTAFGFDVATLNATTTLPVALPITCTLTGNEDTLTKTLPELTGTLNTQGTFAIGTAMNGAGTLNVNGGTLTLKVANTLTGPAVIAQDATLKIENASAITSGTISGAGTLLCSGVLPVSKVGLTDADWTGTITLQNINGMGALSLNDYGHAGSMVCFDSVVG